MIIDITAFAKQAYKRFKTSTKVAPPNDIGKFETFKQESQILAKVALPNDIGKFETFKQESQILAKVAPPLFMKGYNL